MTERRINSADDSSAGTGPSGEAAARDDGQGRVSRFILLSGLVSVAFRARPGITRLAREARQWPRRGNWRRGVHVIDMIPAVDEAPEAEADDGGAQSAGGPDSGMRPRWRRPAIETVESIEVETTETTEAVAVEDLPRAGNPATRVSPRWGDATSAPTATEQAMSEVLADIMELGRVSVTADFFDDLGADSMVMAHFCARLRKREDLPSVSIKEVYQSTTIRSLAVALTARDQADGSAPGPAPRSESSPAPSRPRPETAAPVAAWRMGLCGAMQLLVLVGYPLVSVLAAARGYVWVSDASGYVESYLRLVLVGVALFTGLAAVPIVLKWALVGRSKPDQFPIWSWRYFRFWMVKLLVQANPLIVFAGSPIYVLYLRALGARIGRDVVILSRRVPGVPDLLTIGDNTIIRKDSTFTCYRAHGGVIETGPVTLGKNAFVGELTVLDIDTSLGEAAQLGHASALHAGQSVPDGEHRIGSPAQQITEFDYLAIPSADRSILRQVTYSTAQLLVLFAVSLPLLTVIPILISLPLSPAVFQGAGEWPFSSWTFYSEAMIASLFLLFGFLIVGLVFVCTFPRLLNRAIETDETYPIYGARYWAHRAISRLTNNTFFTALFGDTSYILHYLYCLGYDLSLDGQTGANFGTGVKHESPYHVSLGSGTMAADGLSILNADYSTSSFRLSPVTLGANSFLGNNIAYPSQGKTGDNCLHATKVVVPLEGEVREDVGFLGSPNFEIPRIVLRDRRFDELKHGDEWGRRLAAKNRHNVVTMMLFLLVRWIPLFVAILLLWGGIALNARIGVWAIAVPTVIAPVFGFFYLTLVERASTGFKRLRPLYCSMYELDSWRIERFWKLSWQPVALNGTPFKGIAWRLLGVRMGKRVFDDGCSIIDKTLASVGDDCVLNFGSIIQSHSQEDGTFKSEPIAIGNGCTLGVGALVHYGVNMGDGATLAADSFLMKGAEVAPNTHWGDNPARELQGDRSVDLADTVPVPLPAGGTGSNGSNGSESTAKIAMLNARINGGVPSEITSGG